MTSEDVQDYCDWCYGPLTDHSRTRSRWLGLSIEDAWACAECLQAGRYRVPPDPWIGPPEEWLARDQYILSADDRLAVANALNEVLHGPGAVDDREFHARLGVSRASALQTHRHIGADGLS
ncbi:hypothetical protein [Actinotalea sp. C106]|uniref:hypothetical protein n=1 Tax=Actinotalea sp. C106 TaxID=2908644 RepID=UPI002027709A|nr:hypothetical protein [Actinotalea sp. C106]